MIEIVLGTYGLACWLIFKKFKLVPINTYTVATAILGGVMMVFGLLMILSLCHPVSHDGRLYVTVTQVVPQVRGRVIEVPVKADVPLRSGDVLYKIDPYPFQLRVARQEAMLAGVNAKVAQLDTQLAAAQAATRVARSNLLVSESDFDRQARISLERADERIAQVQSQLALAEANYERSENLPSGTISQQERDRLRTELSKFQSEIAQAQKDKESAEELLESGSNRLQAVRDELQRAEAAEMQAQIARDAEIDGENPEVKQLTADLDLQRWELEQTAVRAPSDGFATYVSLRPGQMVSPLSTNAAIMFVSDVEPTLVATFPQNALAGIEPGLDAEVAFTAYPGRVFKAKVGRILQITPEGQFIGTGRIQATTSADAPSQIPVMFEYDDEIARLNLPAGAKASVAIYTENFHALAIVRKIVLRIKSWENYAFFLQGLNALH